MTIERISLNFAGRQSAGVSRDADCSSDGRYVVFTSDATDLAGGQVGGTGLYVRDMQTGETQRIDRGFDGSLPDGVSNNARISADGRFITFTSTASNLVDGVDANHSADVFLFDRLTNTTTLISTKADGTAASGDSFFSTISANGRYIAYASEANDIRNHNAPEDPAGTDRNLIEGSSDVFVYDIQTGQTLKQSGLAIPFEDALAVNAIRGVSNDGSVYYHATHYKYVDGFLRPVGDGSYGGGLETNKAFWLDTAEGQATTDYAAYGNAPNYGRLDWFHLVGNYEGQSYVLNDARRDDGHDVLLVTRTPEMVMAAGGRFVAYLSDFDYNQQQNTPGLCLYVWDMQSNTVMRLATSSDYETFRNIQISDNGHWITFESDKPLTADDTNGTTDIFRIANPFGSTGAGSEGDYGTDDTILGTPGVDTLQGTAKGETIDALADNDTVLGRGGNDLIKGRGGDDALYGGAGDDLITGGNGDDEIYGGDLTDAADNGDDVLDGGEGGDIIYGGIGDDAIYGGKNYTSPEPGDPLNDGPDVLDGGAGNDVIYGGGGAGDGAVGDGDGDDLAFGGAGKDTIYGNAGDDYLSGGAGGDGIFGGIGNDTIIGDDNADAQHETDILTGGDGDDVIYGWKEDAGEGTEGNGDGTDIVNGGDGEDTIYGNAGEDYLAGGAGADIVGGGIGDDIIGGGGNRDGIDFLLGGAGDDKLYGGEALDETEGATGNGDGDDLIWGGAGNDRIFGNAGDDELEGGAGNDIVAGGIGKDIITGGDNVRADFQADVLNGGDGDDIIWGWKQDEYGDSEADGNDLIACGNGDDTAIGNAGDDAIDGGAGFDLLSGGGGDDSIFGGADDDSVLAGAGKDTAFGDDGNDRLFGDDGNDELYGGEGEDSIDGGAGDDTIDGGAGYDRLFGGGGKDVLIGGEPVAATLGARAAAAALAGPSVSATAGAATDADYLDGGDGDDILVGSTGATLVGGEGSDLFVLAGQSGGSHISIADFAAGTGGDLLDVSALLDRLPVDSDMNPFAGGYLRLEASGDSTVLLLDYDGMAGAASAEQIAVFEHTAPTAFTADQFVQDDLRIIDPTRSAAPIQGTWQADNLKGTSGADTIVGYDGNDVARGGIGSDELLGGYGNDSLFGEAGDDVLRGDADTDSLDGGDGNDILLGGNGGDLLRGGNGDDRLAAGAGVDNLYGGAGNDIFVMEYNGGKDTIYDFKAGAGAGDVIDLSGLSEILDIHSFDQLQARIFASGTGTAIALGSTTVLLSGVKPGQLAADDFLFAPQDEAPSAAAYKSAAGAFVGSDTGDMPAASHGPMIGDGLGHGIRYDPNLHIA